MRNRRLQVGAAYANIGCTSIPSTPEAPVIPDSIERDVLIEAPVDVVWSVVTEPAKIVQWFSDLAEIELRPGGAGALTWTEQDHTAPLVVQAAEPPRLFSFRWSHPEGE